MKKCQNNVFYKSFIYLLVFAFGFNLVLPPRVSAQVATVLDLPIPGTMVPLSKGYNPAIIRGLSLHPENPLEFDFYVDTGDDRLSGDDLKIESNKLIKYFLASLTVPEKELWVNLSPYEKDRIVPESFGVTEMGQDLLAQDYMLKQITSSLIYPEKEVGQAFWDRVYKKALEKYGTTQIPLNTFNKVWIVPDKAVLYEHDGGVYVMFNKLKVMLEEDYIALQKNMGNEKFGMEGLMKQETTAVSGVTSDVVREVLIPELEKEVNEGKNFANLRQIYNSMVLATWYKQNLRQSLLGKVYVDKNKVVGVDVEDKEIKEKIFNQYVESFKKGVFDYIKEDFNPLNQQIIPRKYFSGGAAGYTDEAMIVKIKGDEDFIKKAKAAGIDQSNLDLIKEIAKTLGDDERIKKIDVGIHESPKSGSQIIPKGSTYVQSSAASNVAEKLEPVVDQKEADREYIDQLLPNTEKEIKYDNDGVLTISFKNLPGVFDIKYQGGSSGIVKLSILTNPLLEKVDAIVKTGVASSEDFENFLKNQIDKIYSEIKENTLTDIQSREINKFFEDFSNQSLVDLNTVTEDNLATLNAKFHSEEFGQNQYAIRQIRAKLFMAKKMHITKINLEKYVYELGLMRDRLKSYSADEVKEKKNVNNFIQQNFRNQSGLAWVNDEDNSLHVLPLSPQTKDDVAKLIVAMIVTDFNDAEAFSKEIAPSAKLEDLRQATREKYLKGKDEAMTAEKTSYVMSFDKSSASADNGRFLIKEMKDGKVARYIDLPVLFEEIWSTGKTYGEIMKMASKYTPVALTNDGTKILVPFRDTVRLMTREADGYKLSRTEIPGVTRPFLTDGEEIVDSITGKRLAVFDMKSDFLSPSLNGEKLGVKGRVIGTDQIIDVELLIDKETKKPIRNMDGKLVGQKIFDSAMTAEKVKLEQGTEQYDFANGAKEEIGDDIIAARIQKAIDTQEDVAWDGINKVLVLKGATEGTGTLIYQGIDNDYVVGQPTAESLDLLRTDAAMVVTPEKEAEIKEIIDNIVELAQDTSVNNIYEIVEVVRDEVSNEKKLSLADLKLVRDKIFEFYDLENNSEEANNFRNKLPQVRVNLRRIIRDAYSFRNQKMTEKVSNLAKLIKQERDASYGAAIEGEVGLAWKYYLENTPGDELVNALKELLGYDGIAGQSSFEEFLSSQGIDKNTSEEDLMTKVQQHLDSAMMAEKVKLEQGTEQYDFANGAKEEIGDDIIAARIQKAIDAQEDVAWDSENKVLVLKGATEGMGTLIYQGIDNDYVVGQPDAEALAILSEKDNALVGKNTKGGIDLDPAMLDLQIKRDGNGVPLPVWDQPIENMNIDGFIPVIINVTPANLNLPLFSELQAEDSSNSA